MNKQLTLGEFFKKDLPMALGTLLAPTGFLIFSLVEQQLAEDMRPHLISMADSFMAIVFSAMGLMLSIGCGLFFSSRFKSSGPLTRLFYGLSIGLILSLCLSLLFLQLI